jgi:hypothetical protein
LFIIPLNVLAIGNGNTIINSEGVEMTLEQYNNLKKLFSDMYIDTMTQDDFDEKMSMGIDFDNVQSIKKYIKTEYNHLTGEKTSTEISALEYMMAGTNPNMNNPQATLVETAYKWVLLAVSRFSNTNYGYLSVTGHWKIMPSTRSFDVNAVRFVNASVINGTQSGKQFYTLNGNNYVINYSYNGTNMNDLSNGFGISMNLVNDSITGLESEISASISFDNYPAGFFGSYQHAVSTTTLSESKNYTLSSIGLGNVIHFLDTDTIAKYDGMEGVYTYFMS